MSVKRHAMYFPHGQPGKLRDGNPPRKGLAHPLHQLQLLRPCQNKHASFFRLVNDALNLFQNAAFLLYLVNK